MATNATAKFKYEVVVEKDGQPIEQYAYKCQNLRQMWEAVDFVMHDYNLDENGYLYKQVSVRRDFRANHVGKKGKIIAYDSYDQSVNLMVKTISDESAPVEPVIDNFYYYRWTHDETGETLYSRQHVASPPPIPQRYTITEITREEYEAGVAQAKAEAERERFIMYDAPIEIERAPVAWLSSWIDAEAEVSRDIPVQPLARLEQLEAENARLKAALQPFAQVFESWLDRKIIDVEFNGWLMDYIDARRHKMWLRPYFEATYRATQEVEKAS